MSTVDDVVTAISGDETVVSKDSISSNEPVMTVTTIDVLIPCGFVRSMNVVISLFTEMVFRHVFYGVLNIAICGDEPGIIAKATIDFQIGFLVLWYEDSVISVLAEDERI